MPSSMSDNLGVYLLGDNVYEPSKPSAASNLLEIYGLGPLAASVARFDPITGEKRKLRKSYKNHIMDLPGKHEIPPRGVDQPGSVSTSRTDEAPTLLSIVYSTQSQYHNPIPVLSKEAARTAPGEEYKYKYLQPYEPDLLKRAFGGLEKTPISGIPDFDVSKLAIPPVSKFPAENGHSGVQQPQNGHSIQQFNHHTKSNGGTPTLSSSSSTLGGSLMRSSSSSLHLSNKLHSHSSFPLSTAAAAAAESSNEDATVMRISLKKKKRKERTHTSVSPTSSTGGMGGNSSSNGSSGSAAVAVAAAAGLGMEGHHHDAKRRKTTAITTN